MEGEIVGFAVVGVDVLGEYDGVCDGDKLDGAVVGAIDGDVGDSEGIFDGVCDGIIEGEADGCFVGVAVVGETDGDSV